MDIVNILQIVDYVNEVYIDSINVKKLLILINV